MPKHLHGACTRTLTQQRSSCLLFAASLTFARPSAQTPLLEEYSTPLCLVRLPSGPSILPTCCAHTAPTLFLLTQRYRANPSHRAPGMQGIKNRPCLRKDKGHTLCEPADAATPCHSTVAAACTQSEPGQLLTVTNTSNHDRPHFLLPRSLNIARLHGEPLALAAIYALALSALHVAAPTCEHPRLEPPPSVRSHRAMQGRAHARRTDRRAKASPLVLNSPPSTISLRTALNPLHCLPPRPGFAVANSTSKSTSLSSAASSALYPSATHDT